MILGVVPARGGSRAIRGKNIIECAGKPLLWYTAQAALGSKAIDRTIVSTDDERIAAVSRSFGLDVPFMRPAALAGDEAPMLAVLQHALDWAERNGYRVDALVLLQPTSPLRTSDHIDAVVGAFHQSGADSVVSVTAVPHQFSPGSLYERREGTIVPRTGAEAPTRRQDKETLFARNGPAILVTATRVIAAGSLYGSTSLGFEMPREASVDVDDPFDLMVAECILQRKDGD